MNRLLVTAAGFALAAACGLASAAPWTVIVQPGVYGRVAVGGYAEPPMVYSPQPVVAVDNGDGQVVEESIAQAYSTDQPPVYLWVPEYQRLHWAKYSREYGAYGVPVYFVDDGWYRANVLRRNLTPEQRAWTPQQWLEQDRLARDRFERQRFERQRYEQQQRWNSERVWHEPQQAAAVTEQRALAVGANAGQPGMQTTAASQPRSVPTPTLQGPGERRGPGRGRGRERNERRAEGEGRGGFERGSGNRER